MNNLLITVGLCFRLINGNPYVHKTYKIFNNDNKYVVSEMAIETINGWEFLGQDIAKKDSLRYDAFENIKCPDIKWNK